MSRASEVLQEYRRAEAAAREEVGRLLQPAGLRVSEIAPAGEGWRLHVVPAAGLVGPAPETAPAAAATATNGGLPAPPVRNVTAGVAPLVRAEGETLMQLVARAGPELRVGAAAGAGGVRVAPASSQERMEWLAGTLVGDTILALRHLGEPEDADAALQDLHRQLRLYREQSRRLVGREELAPFVAAVDRWTPPGFPRGAAFLSGAAEVADA